MQTENFRKAESTIDSSISSVLYHHPEEYINIQKKSIAIATTIAIKMSLALW